jgi:serine/threonine protein phosphatase PrpC
MTAPVLRFEQGARTHVGCVRQVNEDAHLARPLDGLWTVADGMGGHVKGQWASAVIVRALEASPSPDGFDAAVAAASAALQAANAEIYAEAQATGQPIGSTVATLLVKEGRFAVLWAGDSRVYLCRGGRLQRLTVDHSQVEQMISSGLLRPEEAEGHPMSHVLSRAVGVRPELQLDQQAGEALAGDMFLLCSDGLSRTVAAGEIERQLRGESPRAAAERLLQAALDLGASDNVTVLVIGCDATTLVEAD